MFFWGSSRSRICLLPVSVRSRSWEGFSTLRRQEALWSWSLRFVVCFNVMISRYQDPPFVGLQDSGSSTPGTALGYYDMDHWLFGVHRFRAQSPEPSPFLAQCEKIQLTKDGAKAIVQARSWERHKSLCPALPCPALWLRGRQRVVKKMSSCSVQGRGLSSGATSCSTCAGSSSGCYWRHAEGAQHLSDHVDGLTPEEGASGLPVEGGRKHRHRCCSSTLLMLLHVAANPAAKCLPGRE